MIKLIAADLDETLLKTDKHVGGFTAKKIHKFTNKGHYFVCATGRNYISIQNTLKEVGNFDKPDTYTISLNGAVVTENKNNKILYSQPMDFELVNKIYKLGITLDVCIHVYTTDKVYAYNMNDGERDFLNGRMEVIEINDTNIDFLKGTDIIKILFENTNYEYLRSIEAKLEPSIVSKVDLSYSSNRYFEFNKKGINKGNGLRFLCEYLHIDIKDTMAIGDNFNDLSMLKAAGLGIGVKNTHKDMQDEVDILLDYTNDEDGVGHAIEIYAL